MKCRRCHKEIPDHSNFCNYCGIKQTISNKSKARGNGQGSVYKQTNGKWTAELTLGYATLEDGRTKRYTKKRTGFETKKAAIDWLEDYKRKGEEKIFTVQELWEQYQATNFKNLSASKQTHYRTAYKRLKPLWFKNIDTLSIGDLQAIIDDYSEFYHACRDIKIVLSQLYKLAMAQGQVNNNITSFLVLPKEERNERNPFNEKEITTMWQSYNSGNLFVGYILIMIYTGMMPGELRKVTRPMVDYEAHTIVGAGIKTEKRQEAPIILADCIIPIIQDLFADHPNNFMLCPYGEKRFYKEYYECLDKLNIRKLTPYSCRHTTATALASLNTNEFVMKEIMRHTKITTTQRYIHTDLEPMINAVNKLG